MIHVLDIEELEVRIGFHSGSVIGGVLRGDKARFQLFGDTVNTASRMESTGLPGRIQLSEEAYGYLNAGVTANRVLPYGTIQREDKVAAKGKGEMTTYWLLPSVTSDIIVVT